MPDLSANRLRKVAEQAAKMGSGKAIYVNNDS